MNWIARVAAGIRQIDLPVLTLEMRRSLRGYKPFVLMFFYVLVLAVLLFVAMGFMSQAGLRGGGGGSQSWKLGQMIFWVLGMAQGIMVMLLIPALTARAITSEVENKTLDTLALSSLGSKAIVNQKLAASVAQVAMLLLASLPVLSVALLMGGVSPLEVAQMFALLLLTAAFYGSVGVLCSAVFGNSRSAILMAYLAVLLMLPMCGINLPLMVAVLILMDPLLGTGGPWYAAAGGWVMFIISLLIIWLLQYVSSRKLESLRRAR